MTTVAFGCPPLIEDSAHRIDMLIQLCFVLRIALNENQQFELQRIDVEPCEATPVKEVPNEKPSFKATMQADDKPEIDMSGNLNSFWARGPVYQEAKTQQEEVRNHRVLYRPPQSLTRLSKTVASGLNPHFNKGYFEPFESRPKPVKLVGIRKNGIFPRKNIEIVSKSSEVAELQSPYNDISNFWLDDPGMPQLKNV